MNEALILTYDSIGKNDDVLDEILEDLKRYKK